MAQQERVMGASMIERHYIQMYGNEIRKPSRNCQMKREMGEKTRKSNRGVNFIKAHHMHV
jgi:hypothetical protein